VRIGFREAPDAEMSTRSGSPAEGVTAPPTAAIRQGLRAIDGGIEAMEIIGAAASSSLRIATSSGVRSGSGEQHHRYRGGPRASAA
jgi:hypothetical protein